MMSIIHSYFPNLLYPISGVNGIELVKYYILSDEDCNPDQFDSYTYFLFTTPYCSSYFLKVFS